MLLDELSREEKKAFWSIANLIAAADGSVSEEESILKQYKEEMGVDYDFIDPSTVDIELELNGLRDISLRKRKIVYFELFGVAYADTDLDEMETSLLDLISTVLGINNDVKSELENTIKSIFDSYKKLGDILSE